MLVGIEFGELIDPVKDVSNQTYVSMSREKFSESSRHPQRPAANPLRSSHCAVAGAVRPTLERRQRRASGRATKNHDPESFPSGTEARDLFKLDVHIVVLSIIDQRDHALRQFGAVHQQFLDG